MYLKVKGNSRIPWLKRGKFSLQLSAKLSNTQGKKSLPLLKACRKLNYIYPWKEFTLCIALKMIWVWVSCISVNGAANIQFFIKLRMDLLQSTLLIIEILMITRFTKQEHQNITIKKDFEHELKIWNNHFPLSVLMNGVN